MIRLLVRAGVVAYVAGWIADLALRFRAQGAPPAAISSLIVIDAPIERVWAELADLEGQPRWMHDLKAVELTTSGPIDVGTRCVGTVRVFGVTTTDPVVITDFRPPTRFALRHTGTFTGEGVITLEPGADGTTTIVRWEERLIAPLLPHLGAALLAPVLGDVFQADLARLRDLVESGARDAAGRPVRAVDAVATVSGQGT